MMIRWCEAHGATAWNPAWTRIVQGSPDYCIWALMIRHASHNEEPCRIVERELS